MNNPDPVTWRRYRNQLLYMKTSFSGYVCMESSKIKFTIMTIRECEENRMFTYFPILSEAYCFVNSLYLLHIYFGWGHSHHVATIQYLHVCCLSWAASTVTYNTKQFPVTCTLRISESPNGEPKWDTSPWSKLRELLNWCPVTCSSHCNSFEDLSLYSLRKDAVLWVEGFPF